MSCHCIVCVLAKNELAGKVLTTSEQVEDVLRKKHIKLIHQQVIALLGEYYPCTMAFELDQSDHSIRG